MEHIREIYDIDYELVSYAGYEELTQALIDGEVDAIFPVYGEYYIGEQEQMMISDPATVSTMTMLNHRSDTDEPKVAAVTKTSPFQQYIVQNYYPNTQVIYCDSIADSIQAVLDGKADFTMMETAIMNERVDPAYRKQIQTVELPINVNISFGVRMGDGQLLGILNKSISMEQSQIDTSLIQHSQTHMTYTAEDFIRDHIGLVLLQLFLVFAIIVALLVAHYRVRLRSERRIMEAEQERRKAKWSAQHDSLTGLLNRTAFQELCQQLMGVSEPLALMIIDVDEFKKVNDTYGHDVGDQALSKVGTLLEHFFRDEDFVIRFAGDEFAVLVMEAIEDQAESLQQKVRAINDILQRPEAYVPKLSISAGIAFSPGGYRETLFNQADKALYHVKANGKCGSFVYKKDFDR
jgi:diguanylate cyclase (GGDEF)-like protein